MEQTTKLNDKEKFKVSVDNVLNSSFTCSRAPDRRRHGKKPTTKAENEERKVGKYDTAFTCRQHKAHLWPYQRWPQ